MFSGPPGITACSHLLAQPIPLISKENLNCDVFIDMFYLYLVDSSIIIILMKTHNEVQ